MSAASCLVVPINLQALRVSDSGNTTKDAGPTTRFDNMPVLGGRRVAKPNLASNVVNPLSTGSASLAPGVHLHWQLPDALARGTQLAQGALSFPAAPDRWLVSRILRPKDKPPSVAQWVIESDRMRTDRWTQNQADGATVPVGWRFAGSDRNVTPFTVQGQVTTLESWSRRPAPGAPAPVRVRHLMDASRPGARPRVLDARGHTGPGFAAYYPDCSGIFGFHDPFPELDTGESGRLPPTQWEFTVGYHVCGWYSVPADDPMQRLSGKDADRLYQALAAAWSLPDGADLPPRMLAAGLLHGLEWQPGTSYPAHVPQGTSVSVAIGSGTSEALAALLATTEEGGRLPIGGDSPFKTAETLLDALQTGLLHQVSPAQGLAQLEVALHRQGFASLSGGHRWSARANGKRDDPAVVTNQEQSQGLSELNAQQAAVDAALRVVASLQRTLALDWPPYHDAAFRDFNGEDEQLRQDIEDLIRRLVALYGGDATRWQFGSGAVELGSNGSWIAAGCTPDSLMGRLATKANAVAALLATSSLTLHRGDAQPFWQPQAPVLVMRGDALRPAGRNDHPEEKLPVRLSADLVRGAAPADLPALRLPVPPSDDEAAALAPVRDAMRAVLDEALLLEGGSGNALPPGCTGTPPAALAMTCPATGTWQEPFLPLYLLWTVALQPLAETQPGVVDPAILTGQYWIDSSSVDLVAKQPPLLAQTTITLSGSGLLSARAAAPLTGQIKAYARDSGTSDPDLAKLAADIQGWPLLSQAAGGLNELMLGCETGLQLVPYNPYADLACRTGIGASYDLFRDPDAKSLDYADSYTATVARCLGNAGRPRPADGSNWFSPLRGGLLRLTALEVVDAFGRRMPLVAPGLPAPVIAPSWRLTPPASLPVERGDAFVPPRLVQPARLLVDWQVAGSDAAEDSEAPTASPINGWVVPNHVEATLMVFDAAGRALCSVGVLGGGSKATILPPAGFAAVDWSRANPHLTDLLCRLVALPEAEFDALMATMDAATDLIQPASCAAAQAQAVLMGRPLALARASLRLELHGVPAFDPHATLGDRPQHWSERPAGGILGLQVPVHLGDHTSIEDGLVAWFTEAPPIYMPAASPGTPFAVPRDMPPPLLLSLRTSDDAAPQDGTVVTMLLDPLASVHTSTGILPVVTAALAPDLVADALRRIELTLFTHPVLRPPDSYTVPGQPAGLALPVPDEPGQVWSWVSAQPNSAPTVEPVIPLAATDRARWGYTPVSLQDGWLRLSEGAPS